MKAVIGCAWNNLLFNGIFEIQDYLLQNSKLLNPKKQKEDLYLQIQNRYNIHW